MGLVTLSGPGKGGGPFSPDKSCATREDGLITPQMGPIGPVFISSPHGVNGQRSTSV